MGHKANMVLFEQDIREIYNTFIKPNINEGYMLRYVPLPLQKNNISWRWEGKDFPRVIAVLEFERFVNENKLSSIKSLAINSGNDPEWFYLPTLNVIKLNYESDEKPWDLHTLDIPEKDFDFIMVNQTLEHVYDPIRCLKNIYNHMKSGGILYLNVPANSIPHALPFHYYTGYTSVGLGAIVRAAGFNILSIGQWGNLEYLKKMFESNDWPDYRKLQNPGINDINYPVIVWIFAVKP